MIQNRGMDQGTFYRGLDLERHDPARNLHRAYGLQLARSLFGHWGLVRRWGRIGRPGRLKTEWFDSAAEAQAALAQKFKEKRRRGYELRWTAGQEDDR